MPGKKNHEKSPLDNFFGPRVYYRVKNKKNIKLQDYTIYF